MGNLIKQKGCVLADKITSFCLYMLCEELLDINTWMLTLSTHFVYRFGQGSGIIHFSEVDCSDDDIHILHCDNNDNRISQCSHDDDVGVVCCK